MKKFLTWIVTCSVIFSLIVPTALATNISNESDPFTKGVIESVNIDGEEYVFEYMKDENGNNIVYVVSEDGARDVVLASGDNRHSGSGEKRQFWSTENSYLQFE